jgi:hypothetical protein
VDGRDVKGELVLQIMFLVQEEVNVRKLMLVMTLGVVLVPLFAAVTIAAEGQLIQCKNVLPCTGSKDDDKILERIGDGKDDRIVPRGGDDLVLANKYTSDRDVVMGSGGFDRINVADGDKLDTANGGKGRDLCIVDARREAGESCARVQVRRP